jgi:hypothetical protein
MNSSTYQQSSRAPAAADPENRLLGRMTRRRLEAEEVRDSLFTLAGRLDARMGGPAEKDRSSPRRLLYLAVLRADRSDFGSLFDRANPALLVERRNSSTVAPQALHLMNDALIMDQARGLAGRPDVTAETDAARRISLLYRLAFGRPATEEEIAVAREFLADAGRVPAGGPSPWEQYAQALLLSNEFLFVD